MDTRPELGHRLEPPAQIGARERAAEALEAREVGADQHQPEVGAVAERRRPDRLVVGLGAQLVDQRLALGHGDRPRVDRRRSRK